jgi:hypothetical protein
MEFQMFKEMTHGMLPDAFTVSQTPEKYYQTRILENQ